MTDKQRQGGRSPQKRSHDGLQPGDATKTPISLPSEEYIADNLPPETYDRLPQVYLTRRALREVDRRNSLQPQPEQTRTATGKSSDLVRFARRGGPDLRFLRGYDGRDMAPKAAPAAAARMTKQISAYDANFETVLAENNIFMPLYAFPDGRPRPKPAGFAADRQRLLAPCDSLGDDFTEADYERFEQRNNADAEGSVMCHLVPTLAGTSSSIPNECSIVFTNMSSMTHNATVRPVPDFFDGASFGALDAGVRKALQGEVAPTKKAAVPLAPNLFLQAKSPAGTISVAKRQACYEGAHGARAMHALQNYGREDVVYDEKAYTYSATYQSGSGMLQLFAHHVALAPDGSGPEYHMTKIHGFVLTNGREAFVEGASAFRNAREMAQEHRDALIRAANERAREAAKKKRGEAAEMEEGASTGSRDGDEQLREQDVFAAVADQVGSSVAVEDDEETETKEGLKRTQKEVEMTQPKRARERGRELAIEP